MPRQTWFSSAIASNGVILTRCHRDDDINRHRVAANVIFTQGNVTHIYPVLFRAVDAIQADVSPRHDDRGKTQRDNTDYGSVWRAKHGIINWGRRQMWRLGHYYMSSHVQGGGRKGQEAATLTPFQYIKFLFRVGWYYPDQAPMVTNTLGEREWNQVNPLAPNPWGWSEPIFCHPKYMWHKLHQENPIICSSRSLAGELITLQSISLHLGEEVLKRPPPPKQPLWSCPFLLNHGYISGPAQSSHWPSAG